MTVGAAALAHYPSHNYRYSFFPTLPNFQVDIEALRELSWSGIPPKLRPDCWRILLGYAPPNRERRETILARKRQEYRDFVPSYYEGAGGANASEDEVTSLRQASVCGRGMW